MLLGRPVSSKGRSSQGTTNGTGNQPPPLDEETCRHHLRFPPEHQAEEHGLCFVEVLGSKIDDTLLYDPTSTHPEKFHAQDIQRYPNTHSNDFPNRLPERPSNTVALVRTKISDLLSFASPTLNSSFDPPVRKMSDGSVYIFNLNACLIPILLHQRRSQLQALPSKGHT